MPGVSRATRTFFIRTSALCLLSVGVFAVGVFMLVLIDHQTQHGWRNVPCTIIEENIGPARALTGNNFACSLRLVNISGDARLEASRPSPDDLLCAVIFPHTPCSPGDLQSPGPPRTGEPVGSNVSLSVALGGEAARGSGGPQAPRCEVPVGREGSGTEVIWASSGLCSGHSVALRPLRAVHVAATRHLAERAAAESLDDHRELATWLTIGGASGMLLASMLTAYACYWHALVMCASLLTAKHRSYRRQQRKKWWRQDRPGDSDSDSDAALGQP